MKSTLLVLMTASILTAIRYPDVGFIGWPAAFVCFFLWAVCREILE